MVVLVLGEELGAHAGQFADLELVGGERDDGTAGVRGLGRPPEGDDRRGLIEVGAELGDVLAAEVPRPLAERGGDLPVADAPSDQLANALLVERLLELSNAIAEDRDLLPRVLVGAQGADDVRGPGLPGELARRGGQFGLMTVCAAGGLGFAMVVERV